MRARILNASAGSGKTYQLAYKYVRDVVEQPGIYRHILAVTFTNKATEEMKSRILKEIHLLASGQPSSYLDNLCRELSLDAATVRRRAGLVLLLLLLVMLIPIREYTLVPAEVISLNSEVIAAPSDGVIHQMKVPPNTPVVAGQVLAELDDTTLKNRLAIAQAELATATVNMHQASQQAIEDPNARAELALTEGKWREQKVQVASLQRELEKLSIRARSSGVFVYTDPDDWAGRPVQTGERIGLLADPTKLGVRAWAPAAESTNLNPHAAMTVFLKVAPLHPLTARLDYAGYETVEAPNGVASYLLRGTVTDPSSAARIGLQGTARVSGDWSLLGYLIFRRPLATLRAWCGF
mgnify:CR=1 FL=1